jgi:putative 4-mercaptohistidine N1-methyltranferase
MNTLLVRRLCNSAAPAVRSTAASGSTVYESSRAVDEYLQFHYGSVEDILPYADAPHSALNFVERIAKECSSAPSKTNGSTSTRALDVGCSVGGASFALKRYFDKVVGIDFSHAFIDAANNMKAEGSRGYVSAVQADIMENRIASVPEGIDRSCVEFEQGDACDLPLSLGQFDAVLCSNLLCRLPKPQNLLQNLPNLVKKDGLAVLVSPYSWLEEYTDKEHWLGGYYGDDGASVDSFEQVKEYLEESFTLVDRKDMPFLIREHARKYQWGTSDATIWQRK